jgi:energy-coupling factor transporter transmembrane protein EcfT
MKPLQGMDPLVVFIGVLIISALAFAVTDLAILLVLLCAVVLLAALYGRELGRYARGAKGLVQMVLVISFFQVLLYRGGAPMTISTPLGDLDIATTEGLYMAGRIAARIGMLLASALVFNVAVSTNDFIDALGRTRLPYQFILALDIAIRAVPKMMEDAHEIRCAYNMVHHGKVREGLLRGWTTYVRMAKPLFLIYMGKAWKLGISLELRGFASRAVRRGVTYRFHWKDGLALIVYAAAILFLAMDLAGCVPALTSLLPAFLRTWLPGMSW